MSEVILITVAGIPQPQGSSAGWIKQGRVVITSANKNLKPWREILAITSRMRWGKRPALNGRVSLRLTFYFPRPKGHFTSKGELRSSAPFHHTVRPDLDKLNRAVGDALKVAGVYRDDSQVFACYSSKWYVSEERLLERESSRTPGVRIEVVGDA